MLNDTDIATAATDRQQRWAWWLVAAVVAAGGLRWLSGAAYRIGLGVSDLDDLRWYEYPIEGYGLLLPFIAAVALVEVARPLWDDDERSPWVTLAPVLPLVAVGVALMRVSLVWTFVWVLGLMIGATWRSVSTIPWAFGLFAAMIVLFVVALSWAEGHAARNGKVLDGISLFAHPSAEVVDVRSGPAGYRVGGDGER